MPKKKPRATGCSYGVALRIMGGDEGWLRELAPTRGAFYMWRSAGEVPWHAVGPRLLELYEAASRGRGLVPAEELGHWIDNLDLAVRALKWRVREAAEKDRGAGSDARRRGAG